jgi:hypothetical protein
MDEYLKKIICDFSMDQWMNMEKIIMDEKLNFDGISSSM